MRASLKVSLTSCCLQPRGLRAYRTLHTSGGVLEGVWHSWRGHSAPHTPPVLQMEWALLSWTGLHQQTLNAPPHLPLTVSHHTACRAQADPEAKNRKQLQRARRGLPAMEPQHTTCALHTAHGTVTAGQRLEALLSRAMTNVSRMPR